MEFGSKGFLKEVMKRSNADEKHLELTKGENASYTFVIQAEPRKSVEKDVILNYPVEEGVTADIWLGERKTEFTISGKHGIWENILTGKTGVTKAFLMRKLRVSGSLMKIVKLSAATERWPEILRTIPTESHDEYAKYNIEG